MKIIVNVFLILAVFLCAQVSWAQPKNRLVEYTGSEYRDPLEPLLDSSIKTKKIVLTVEKKEKIILPGLSLEGLIWGAHYPQAIIDGEVLRIGDIIKEAKILDIRKGEVHLLYKGDELILRPKAPEKNWR